MFTSITNASTLDHSVTSFTQRATQLKASSVLKLMDDIETGKVSQAFVSCLHLLPMRVH